MRIIIIYILLLTSISCNKKHAEFNENARQEKETYQLINEAYLPYLEKIGNINSKFGKPKKQIFEIPRTLSEIDSMILKKVISKGLLSDIDTVGFIKKWDKKKLDNVHMIDEQKFDEFLALNRTNDFDLFFKTWEKEIGVFYINISNPIFFDNYNEAFISTNTTDNDWYCGYGSFHALLFQKKNGKWEIKSPNSKGKTTDNNTYK